MIDFTTRRWESRREFKLDCDSLSSRVTGAAIDAHRELEPGLLESTREQCPAREPRANDIQHSRQLALPVRYNDNQIDCGCRVGPMVDNRLIVELTSADMLWPIHEAQLLTWMKLARANTGLLMNLKVKLRKNDSNRLVS